MTLLKQLVNKGQSPWLDYISKKIIDDGTLVELIEKGATGLTSNPSIFDNAISKTEDYDDVILNLAKKDGSIFEIYDDLTIADIQAAADLFLPLYESTGGKDGYVSLEINPKLARDLDATIAEGERVYNKVARKNLMLKVPATVEGLPAVERFTSKGFNVNVTLIFSVEQYEAAAKAYIRGIEKRKAAGEDITHVHSVASVFISRVDTAADKILTDENLKGKTAVANGIVIYDRYKKLFGKFEGNHQRVLWASTGTKNKAYSDIKYVEELVFPNTVNTMPENTMRAFLDHGKCEYATLTVKDAEEIINAAATAGADLKEICAKLLDDGIVAFEKAFASLLDSIEKKAGKLTGEKR